MMEVESEKSIVPGNTVALTVRPEQIAVSWEKADIAGDDMNCLQGVVEEIIYTEFLSKYFIRINDTTLRVFRQHVDHRLAGGRAITWRDPVYVGWHAGDVFVVEIREA